MTAVQKNILSKLLHGYSFAGNQTYGFRLYDENMNVQDTFTYRTYFKMRKLLRKDKSGRFVLDKRKVRSLHGKSWIKKEYKKQLHVQQLAQQT
jgi:hypothetical protein